MNDETLKVRFKFHVARGRTGHRRVRNGPAPPPEPQGHVPRISRLMALAIRFEQLIRDGVVRDQAELARLAFVSRARVTQIMDLLMLAPDIQEALLFLPPVHRGRDPIKAKDLRPLIAELDWRRQRRKWDALNSER